MNISGRTASPDIALADDVTHEAAMRALLARGVDQPEALLELCAPMTVLAWCRWFDDQGQVDKRILAARIRSGQSPPVSRKSRLGEQANRGDRIVEFLRVNVPQVCRMDPKIVEWERKVYGETSAARMAAYDGPHYAAITAIWRAGKGLPVRELRRLALAAVRASDEEAVRDYKAIFAKKETNSVQEA